MRELPLKSRCVIVTKAAAIKGRSVRLAATQYRTFTCFELLRGEKCLLVIALAGVRAKLIERLAELLPLIKSVGYKRSRAVVSGLKRPSR